MSAGLTFAGVAFMALCALAGAAATAWVARRGNRVDEFNAITRELRTDLDAARRRIGELEQALSDAGINIPH